MTELRQILITGGGLSGLAAAFWCRKQNGSVPIVLYEREPEVLSWMKRKGLPGALLGIASDSDLAPAEDYLREKAYCLNALSGWPGSANRDWLKSLGLEFVVRPDNGLWVENPSIFREKFLTHLQESGIELKSGFSLESISKQPDGTFRIWSRDGATDRGSRLLLATGGERNHGLALARECGLDVNQPVPAFIRLKLASRKLAEGLAPMERSVRIRCPRSGVEAFGEVSLTTRGLEGSAISRLSGRFCDDWKQRAYRISLEIDWVPEMSSSALRGELDSRNRSGRRKAIAAEPLFGFSPRQWLQLLATSRIDPETPWVRLRTKNLQTLVQRLKFHHIAFSGMGLPVGERACGGGVETSQIDWSTGMVRGVPGLYFAGEILDFLGAPCGPHLNLIWASGYLAGSAMGLASD